MNEYSAIQLEDKAFHIVRDGSHLTCPKTAIAIPKPSRIQGQIDLTVTKFNCSTQCPFACINERLQKFYYEISCEGQKKEFALSEIKPLDEKKKPIHIIGQA